MKMIDMSEQKFGKWFVLEIDSKKRKKDGNIYWMCECECGKKQSVSGNHLRRGTSKSCRECSEHKHKDKLNSRTWNRIVYGARKRSLEVSVTREYLYDLLYNKQNCKCALTGIEIELANTIDGDMHGESTASPDRIDSSKGYIKGNVQWIHKHINRMKGKLDQDVFVKLCGLVCQSDQFDVLEVAEEVKKIKVFND